MVYVGIFCLCCIFEFITFSSKQKKNGEGIFFTLGSKKLVEEADFVDKTIYSLSTGMILGTALNAVVFIAVAFILMAATPGKDVTSSYKIQQSADGDWYKITKSNTGDGRKEMQYITVNMTAKNNQSISQRFYVSNIVYRVTNGESYIELYKKQIQFSEMQKVLFCIKDVSPDKETDEGIYKIVLYLPENVPHTEECL